VSILAVDERCKVAVFAEAGLTSRKVPMPEIDTFNFAPAVKIPVLMINGEHDALFPSDSNQRPLFQFLGTPKKDNSHRVFDGGHSVPHDIVARETISWLDRYLGAVERQPK
jgi:hypothetical protein